MRRQLEVNWLFVLSCLGLLAVGIYTLVQGSGPTLGFRQLLWVGIGLTAAAVSLGLDYRVWGNLGILLYLINGAILVLVLGVGVKVNGSQSWLNFGPFHVQPSEFMKVCVVMVAARVLAAERRERPGPATLAVLALVVGLPLVLVAKQPDFGTALTFGAIFGVYLVVGGLRRWAWIALMVLGVGAGFAGWNHVLKDYQKERIRTFLTPEEDPLAMGYQVIQSQIAIGSGGWSGRGFAEGTQGRLDFLPEKSTDFVFAVLAEAWGFAGSALVLMLYGIVLWHGFRIAASAGDAYGAYLALGIMTVVSVHILINLGMVTGLMPTIGIPLPLLSYGGSSMVTMLIALALVVNVAMRRAKPR